MSNNQEVQSPTATALEEMDKKSSIQSSTQTIEWGCLEDPNPEDD